MIRLLCLVFFLVGAQAQARDTIRVAMPNKVVTLDPVESLMATDRFLVPLVFEYLFENTPQGEIKPKLAEKWEFEAEKSILWITLRKGHTFSDGTPVTTDDVLRSFQLLCRKSRSSFSGLLSLKGCRPGQKPGLVVRDKNVIGFHIAHSPASFLYQLSYGTAVVFKKTASGKVIGSGPYHVSSFQPHRVHLEGKGRPSLIFEHVEEEKLKAAMASGKYLAATMFQSYSLEAVDRKKFKIMRAASAITQSLILNPRVPPFDNITLRRQLWAAIFEEGKLWQCKSLSLPATGFIPTGIGGSFGVNRGIVAQILRQLDIPPVTPVTQPAFQVKVAQHRGRKNTCEAERLKEIFGRFGIALSIKYYDDYRELLPVYYDPENPAYIELFTFPSRDAMSSLRRLVPDDGKSLFHFKDSEIEELLQVGLSSKNFRSRFDAYRAINRKLIENASVVPLYYIGHINAIHKCIDFDGEVPISHNPNSYIFLSKIRSAEACKP